MLMNTIPHEPLWVPRARRILTAPVRMAVDVVFCVFVVIAAYGMLVFCAMLAFFDNLIFAPLARLIGRPAPQRPK
jgi:hypothetical protein